MTKYEVRFKVLHLVDENNSYISSMKEEFKTLKEAKEVYSCLNANKNNVEFVKNRYLFNGMIQEVDGLYKLSVKETKVEI